MDQNRRLNSRGVVDRCVQLRDDRAEQDAESDSNTATAADDKKKKKKRKKGKPSLSIVKGIQIRGIGVYINVYRSVRLLETFCCRPCCCC